MSCFKESDPPKKLHLDMYEFTSGETVYFLLFFILALICETAFLFSMQITLFFLSLIGNLNSQSTNWLTIKSYFKFADKIQHSC